MPVEGWRNCKHAVRHADKILPEEATPVLSNQPVEPHRG